MRFVSSLVCMAVALSPVSLPAGAQDGVPDNTRIDLDVTDDPSQQYRRSLEERERQDEEAARELGDTSLPRLVGPGEERPQEVPHEPVAVAEPEPRAPERTAPPARVELEVPRGDGSEDGLGLAIGLLFEQWNRTPNVVRIVYGSGVEDDGAGEAVAGPEGGEAEPTRVRSVALPRVAAGEGLYGRVLYGVSSDYPGPVLLEVLQHPLSGAVLRGGFEVVRDRLVRKRRASTLVER